MKKTALILSFIGLPFVAQAQTMSSTVIQKQEKIKAINELIIDRDKAISSAQSLPKDAKTKAITKAQAEFWKETDPLLIEAKVEPSLIDKALHMIKNIFR